jgi:hypothetical protein
VFFSRVFLCVKQKGSPLRAKPINKITNYSTIMFKLFLQQIVDDLFSVSPVGCWDIRDVNPIRAAAVVLPDKLVKL